MNKKLRVGIIGLGRIFDLHCLGYLENPDAEIVALCDTQKDLLQKRAKAFPEAAETLLRAARERALRLPMAPARTGDPGFEAREEELRALGYGR